MSATNGADGEIRMRVLIDRDMPDLIARLGGSKRPAREVIHLLRLGVQFEKYFNSQGPAFPTGAIPAPNAPHTSAHIKAPTAIARKDDVSPDSAAQSIAFVQETGLTADYFSSAPQQYVD